MDTVMAYLPLARATVGFNPNGSSNLRQWMLIIHVSDASTLSKSQILLLKSPCQEVLSNAAPSFLRDIALCDPKTAEDSVLAAVTSLLSSVDLSANALVPPGVTLTLASPALRSGLIEVSSVTEGSNLGDLANMDAPFILYEVLSNMAASIAAGTPDSQWAEGRLFEMGQPLTAIDATAMLTSTSTATLNASIWLSKRPASKPEVTLLTLASLVGEMFRMRTDPLLRISGAALAAAQVPKFVIQQLARGTGRVRWLEASAALLSAPFELPRYDLTQPSIGFPPVFTAGLAMAADALLKESGLQEVQHVCTASIDTVLARAEDLTALQIKSANRNQQALVKAAMNAALSRVRQLCDTVRSVMTQRFAPRGDSESCSQFELCLAHLDLECAAGLRVIDVQARFSEDGTFSNKNFVVAKNSLFDADMSLAIYHLFIELRWARYGFPPLKYESNLGQSFQTVLEKYKNKLNTLTQPGTDEYKKTVETIRDELIKTRGIDQKSGNLILGFKHTGKFVESELQLGGTKNNRFLNNGKFSEQMQLNGGSE